MHVGVFLKKPGGQPGLSCLPHARGGVSYKLQTVCEHFGSSPCTWGCFHNEPLYYAGVIVFPMHVGVFLNRDIITPLRYGLPHARGGVSSYSLSASQ